MPILLIKQILQTKSLESVAACGHRGGAGGAEVHVAARVILVPAIEALVILLVAYVLLILQHS